MARYRAIDLSPATRNLVATASYVLYSLCSLVYLTAYIGSGEYLFLNRLNDISSVFIFVGFSLVKFLSVNDEFFFKDIWLSFLYHIMKLCCFLFTMIFRKIQDLLSSHLRNKVGSKGANDNLLSLNLSSGAGKIRVLLLIRKLP